MITDNHIQKLRVSTNPSFHLRWWITSRQGALSTWSFSVCHVLCHQVSWSTVLFQQSSRDLHWNIVWSIEGVQEGVRTSARVHATSFPVLLHRSEMFDLLSTLLVALPWFPGYQALRASPYPSNIWKFHRPIFHTYSLLLRGHWADWRNLLYEESLRRFRRCHWNVWTITLFLCSSNILFQKHWIHEKTGCPLSRKLIIIISTTSSYSPFGAKTWIPYNFFSDPGPRNDQCPCAHNFRA